MYFAVVMAAALLGCGGSTVGPVVSTPRAYNGTASVGDFLNITLDPVAHTIAYTNRSNGDAGTVPYTVNADGTYTLNDPAGNLVAAYEVPNYALIIQAAKTGPNHNTPALITAVQSGPISISTWASHSYNYMQFRTAAGGLEVGSVNISAAGDVTPNSYWPYGAMNNAGGAFSVGQTFDHTLLQNDPSGTFMKLSDGQGSFDYIFGTPNGVFAVDTNNGAILGLQKAASKNFDPTFAGSYKAIYYQKTGANTGFGNVETGTSSLGKATMVITPSGGVTVQDAQNHTLVQATLIPVADAPYLYDGTPNTLHDPCFGLFTFRLTSGGVQQDVFVTFMDRSILFSSFSTAVPTAPGNTYDYLYGVGLK
jgi:hypothetical protein